MRDADREKQSLPPEPEVVNGHGKLETYVLPGWHRLLVVESPCRLTRGVGKIVSVGELERDDCNRRRKVEYDAPLSGGHLPPPRTVARTEPDSPSGSSDDPVVGQFPDVLDAPWLGESHPQVAEVEFGRERRFRRQHVQSVDAVGEILRREPARDAVVVTVALDKRRIPVEPPEAKGATPGRIQGKKAKRVEGRRLERRIGWLLPAKQRDVDWSRRAAGYIGGPKQVGRSGKCCLVDLFEIEQPRFRFPILVDELRREFPDRQIESVDERRRIAPLAVAVALRLRDAEGDRRELSGVDRYRVHSIALEREDGRTGPRGSGRVDDFSIANCQGERVRRRHFDTYGRSRLIELEPDDLTRRRLPAPGPINRLEPLTVAKGHDSERKQGLAFVPKRCDFSLVEALAEELASGGLVRAPLDLPAARSENPHRRSGPHEMNALL